jgi:ACS family hexuronate transporter-like MFS transporter
MFPRAAVGSIVGIGGFAGAAGGVLFQRATGWVLQHNGSNYTPIFAVCGLAYVTALAVVHLLAPRLEPVGA